MTIDLSLIEFENDFFQTELPDGSILALCKLDEAIASDEGDVVINNILLQLTDTEENITTIPSVIGMSKGSISLLSDYEELLGQVLTSENLSKCTIEVSEDE